MQILFLMTSTYASMSGYVCVCVCLSVCLSVTLSAKKRKKKLIEIPEIGMPPGNVCYVLLCVMLNSKSD